MNMLTCPKCNMEIELDQALERQIEEKIRNENSNKHQAEIEAAKKEVRDSYEKQMAVKLQIEIDKSVQEKELELEKMKAEIERNNKKSETKQALLIQNLKDDADSAKDESKELREQLTELTKALREEKKSRENAQLEAQKKLNDEADKIREEAKKEANESNRLKQQELEMKLNNTQKALDIAQQKAEQGSEQIQGEVLELQLEEKLKSEFPQDKIEEIKKGIRGADIKQVVRNNLLENCGLLLWETKNAKWTKTWIAKMKSDVREINADIGIIVSCKLPEEYGEMCNVDGSIWVVKPKLAYAIATALRLTLIQVHNANLNSENRDTKMEILYKFLTGTEFKHRIEAIVDNYGMLQSEIEKEKRAAEKRWAKQEKAIRLIVDNTYGLYGDLQGIAGQELQIPLLETSEE